MTTRLHKQIFRLALPALATLIAQPLFALLDTVMVGHLGALPLAGLGVAGTVLTMVIGLMVFLAYANTPKVAAYYGAGNMRGAVSSGVDGLYLAAGLGVLVAVAVWVISDPLLAFISGSNMPLHTAAASYLTVAVWGVPAMLISLAATGFERGVQNTVSPLVITSCGFAANAVLNFLFIYGLGFGLVGSAVGTVIAEWIMATIFAWRILARAKKVSVGFVPSRQGLRDLGGRGFWLLIRTVCMQTVILLTVITAAGHSVITAAGLTILNSLFMFCAFVLDSLAIAAQALLGKAVGAGMRDEILALTRTLLVYAAIFGVAFGLVVVCLQTVLPQLFSSDPHIIKILPPAIAVLGFALPICALVFLLDGILMGLSANKYLALSSVINAAGYIPAVLALSSFYSQLHPREFLIFLAVVYLLLYMSLRLVTLSVSTFRVLKYQLKSA